jgi:hypothetical protein
MKNNKQFLEKYYCFLTSTWGFKEKEVKSYGYAIYAKFLSNVVGIHFVFEYRDSIPSVQFTLLNSDALKPRAGIYTIKELYQNENFKLQSFYLDEIMLFKQQEDYRSFFKEVKTIEQAIKISSELAEHYAVDFISGNVESYNEIDRWFRSRLMEDALS